LVKRIEGLPQNVVGFSAGESVTAEDYTQSILPAVEQALKGNGKIRFLCYLEPEFKNISGGALLEDAKMGLGHLNSFEKIAIVTEVGWVINGIKMFSFVMPCPVEIFPTNRFEDAKAWIVQN